MTVQIKRVYEPKNPADGYRILVDRLWPRGMAKGKAGIDEWPKDVAPSDRLRKWFGHDPERWEEFRERYKRELHSPGRQATIRKLRSLAAKMTITLLFAARDEIHNNARVLAEFLGDD